MTTVYAPDLDQYITSDPRLLVPVYGDTASESEQRAADALAVVSSHKAKNADEPAVRAPRLRPTLIPTGHLQWWLSPDNGKSQFYGEPRKIEAAKEFHRSLVMGH